MREHLRSARVLLTGVFLLVQIGLGITDRGDDLLQVLGLALCGFALGLAWLVQVIRALWRREGRKRVLALIVEAMVSCFVMGACVVKAPFYLAFPLSRPALEQLVRETPRTIPNEECLVQRWVGLVYVYRLRQRDNGNTELMIHSNMSYAHMLVYCPKKAPEKFAADTPFLGEHWYRSSWGM